MRKIIMAVLAALVIAAFAAAPAAATSTGNRGQPSQSCGTDPGQSPVEPRGFTDSAGFANAEQHYAGSEGTPSAANGNFHAVAQYDVACFQLSGH